MNIQSNSTPKLPPLAQKNLPALDMELLKSFVAIAEMGNFTKAAEQVFRTPSAISMQIKRLEEILGTAVFIRDSRSVKLTGNGEMLLGYARRLLALNGEIMGKFLTPNMVGTVRIGSHSEYAAKFIPDILKRFAETHPNVMVDVTVQTSSHQREMLKNGELDIAMATANEKENADPNTIILLEERLTWVGLKGGCAYQKRPLPISVWDNCCAWRKHSEEALGRENIDYRVAYMSQYNEAQKAAVLADLALAVSPISSIELPLMAYGEKHGLPQLPKFKTVMLHADNLNCAAEALKNHVIASFESLRT